MRMWMVDVKLMCDKHLIGEHGEIHKHKHNFVKKHSVSKRVILNQIEPKSMKTRHDILANEMIARGFNHVSPYEMPDISYLPKEYQEYIVNVDSSYKDLTTRCLKCKQRRTNEVYS